MTPKQAERIKTKIKRIKAELAADKKRWGGYYDDSHGLRYMPPRFYIQLGDYTGGLNYMNWFKKNFPNDSSFPEFLFEWTIILFKTGRLKEAAHKAFETFCRNTYFFDKFFGRSISPADKYEGSNLEVAEYTEYLEYSAEQAYLADFAEWLKQFTQTEKFLRLSDKYIQIYIQLKTEDDREKRHYLIKQASQLKNEL